MLRKCAVSGWILGLSRLRRLRRRRFWWALRLEGGEFFSATAREILEQYHGVTIWGL